MKTVTEQMLMKVALERFAMVEEFMPYSITNELHGLIYLALEARSRGLVSGELIPELEAMVKTAADIDLKRSITNIMEIAREEVSL